MAILSDEEVRSALANRRAWRRSGDALVRERACRDFAEALALLERLGEAAEDYGRHPEMTITDGNRVRVRVANPHGAGFTDAELRLVAKVDEVTAAVAAEAAAPPKAPRGPLAAVAAAVVSAPAAARDAAPLPSRPPTDSDGQRAQPGPPEEASQPRGRRGAAMAAATAGGVVVGAVAARLVQRR